MTTSPISEEILDALHWCRLGKVRPERDGAFHDAKRLGLLAQDPVWRTTVAGEVALANARPEAYGQEPMAVECPYCNAKPYEPCREPLRRQYQLYHARRSQAARRARAVTEAMGL